ncbi:IclR family transcriptional regulator [Streptomyces sp. NPDC057137]|uniref:IclR family transcriptional regulator n=1 Tax=Streptomyces sp. NPDC057137 TaxID=3346030 RepID=UPI003631C31E
MRNSDVEPPSAADDAGEPAVTGTQSVFRALSILHAFSSLQPALTGPEVATKFGYSLPTAYRLLRALEAEQFLVFDRVTRRYRPGPEILRLSGVMLHRDGVVAQTQSSLVRLRALTGETVAIFWRLGNQRTCVQEMVSPHPVRIEAGVGVDYPLTRGAPGKALLLALDERNVREILNDPDVASPIHGISSLLAELEDSRERGYTMSADETIDGAVSIAAPIAWLHEGLAAYSITAPKSRFGPRERETAARTLLEEMARLRSALRR